MAGNSKTTIAIDTATMFRVVFVGLLFVFLFYIRDLLLIFFTALVIASFIEPVVDKFKKYHIPRLLTVMAIFTVSILFIAGLLYILIPTLFAELASLVQLISKFLPDQSFLHTFDQATVQSTKKLFTSITNNVPLQQVVQSANSILFSLSGGIADTLAFTFGGIFNIALTVILAFYLSIQEKGVENFLRIITPKEHESYVVSLWNRTEKKIGLWIQGQLLLGLIVGLIIFIMLSLFRVEYALLLALLVFILELIPFGLILATIPGILFAYAQGGVFFAFKIFLGYLIVGQIETYSIAPLITKRMVGVPPIVMILSVLIGAQLAGAWGIMLAIPASVLILEYIDDIEKAKRDSNE
jgi:predicted PurR-regulated permease PerM